MTVDVLMLDSPPNPAKNNPPQATQIFDDKLSTRIPNEVRADETKIEYLLPKLSVIRGINKYPKNVPAYKVILSALTK